MDIEAWLVCEKNKLTVSTLVSIFVGHGGWAPRTWTDSLLASDNGSTNGLQHFVLINLSQGFWTLSSSKRRKQAFPSPRHPTPPHPTKKQIWATAPGTITNNKTCFGWGVGGRDPDCFVFQALPCLTTAHLYDLDNYYYTTHCMC